jgi:hypothetical protein
MLTHLTEQTVRPESRQSQPPDCWAQVRYRALTPSPTQADVQVTVKCVQAAVNPDGCWHGRGSTFHTSTGVAFEGTLDSGNMHGKSSIQFPDGVCFDGMCVSNALTGLGVVSYEGMRYHGALRDGKHHGYGKLEVMGGGSLYEGAPRS